ncbi:MAG TPA: RICIN domain-containing protein [Lacunisphaera sp.]
MKRLNSILPIGAFLLLLAFGWLQAHAYNHPCIPSTLDDLATIKASLNQEPWKSGYALLAATSTAQLGWTMDGPYANVSRAGSFDANLTAWQNSMDAVYNLARMSCFTTGATSNAYAQKAHDILIAWATTNTTFNGNEAGLALGDNAYRFAGGASILRGTWSGWTAADTTTVKNYFLNVLWPNCQANLNITGPNNKGDLAMAAGISIAVFCDDTAKFDHIVDLYRTYHGSGLRDTLPTGQHGETGRDLGHAFGTVNALAYVAEVAWKQGVDLFSELDNRLLACGEYYSRNTYTTDNPYVPFGSIDWQWLNNVSGPYTGDRACYYILQNAYKNRKNLPTPWIDRKLQDQPLNNYNWMYAKTADFTTATAMTPASFPTVSPASSGLTLTTLGTQTAGRNLSYANGTWTLGGLGNGTWNDTTDDAQFAYTAMTGDCAMVARVTSYTKSGSQNGKTGLMIRDSLNATTSQRAFVDVTWWSNDPNTNCMEHFERGYTQTGSYNQISDVWSPSPALPYWLKIERRGQQVTSFVSIDGASWSPMACAYYGNLPSTIYLGLFLSSGTTTAQTATFDNVAFTGGTGGPVLTPAAPKGILASGSNKAITVRWLTSYGATAYDLLRSTTSGSGYTALASNLTGASYVDTTAVAGTTYYYVVRAKNSAGTSGNSSQFGAALISAPMVNLTFSGTATASDNQNSSTEGPAKAFDSNPGTKWFGFNSPTGWIQYDFGAGNAQVVKRYTINCADLDTRDPKSWNFRASQDGVSWTWLASASNQTFDYRMQQKVYDISNTTAYRFYRLEITVNNGATGVAISELGLWGDSGQTIPDGRYRIVSRKSNKVLDLVNGGTADGTDAVQWGWDGGNDQKWDLAYLGNGQYKLTGLASGKLLEVTNASTADGAIVQIWPSNNNNCQKWTITPAGDGAFKLLNVNSGKAVDVSGGSTADGAAIIQWPYGGADNQQWRMSLSIP